MGGRWSVRPAEAADADAIWLIENAAQPNWPYPRDRVSAIVANESIRVSVACDGDRVVGHCLVNRLADGRANVRVYVHLSARSEGVGSMLAVAALREVRRLGAKTVTSVGDSDDARSLAIARHWGFEREAAAEDEGGEYTFVLLLAAQDVGGSLPAGITMRPFAEHDADDLWSIYEQAVTDKPRFDDDQPDVAVLKERLAAEDLVPSASLVAWADGRPVGFTIVTEAAPGIAHVELTGVDRTHRQRGIATALKRASIGELTRAGYERLLTECWADNAPILAVNRKLGFTRVELVAVSRSF